MGLKQDENAIKSFFLFMILITLVFMFVFTYLGVKIHNGDTCERNFYGSKPHAALDNSTFLLLNPGDYLLTEFFFNDSQNLKYDFCYNINVESENGLRIRITDEVNNTYAEEFVLNNTQSYCTNLDSSLISFKNNLGVVCDNCDSSNNITIMSQLTGANIKNVYNLNNTLSVSNSDRPGYLLIGWGSCRNIMKFYWFLYMTTLTVIGLIALMIFGIKKFQEELYKGF